MNKKVYMVDVSWMYDQDYDQYEEIFDILPREAFINFILSLPDIPGVDDNITDYFTVLYKIEFDTDEGVERFLPMLDIITESFMEKLNRLLPKDVSNDLFIVGWVNVRTIALSSSSIAGSLNYPENILSKNSLFSPLIKKFNNHKHILGITDDLKLFKGIF